jgi:hypothetical protein
MEQPLSLTASYLNQYLFTLDLSNISPFLERKPLPLCDLESVR